MAHESCLRLIPNSAAIVTPHNMVVRGFIAQARAKFRVASSYVSEAIKTEIRLANCRSIDDILEDYELRAAVLLSAGLSTKAQGHLTDDEMTEIAKAALEEVEGDLANIKTEILYRYLLTAGDSLGGSMRNITGSNAQSKLAQAVIQKLTLLGIEHTILRSRKGKVQVIHWKNRTLSFDKTPDFIGNNLDVILLNIGYTISNFRETLNSREHYLAVGELKGGIDPAGADEHWKTANSALDRVRSRFNTTRSPALFFAGAAIESAMADEIYHDLINDRLEFAINISIDIQFNSLIDWLVSL